MMKSKRPLITKSRLVKDLKRIGLRSGQVVMLHASVKSIGWIVGGPDVVIASILDVIKPSGTLMMYISWENSTYELVKWPKKKQQAYREECPAFNPDTSRAYQEWSILTERLRSWPGACRSDHPDASFAAVGKRARWITKDHPLQYGYGPGTPLDKLCRADGKVLMLGAPLTTITLVHHAEHLADIPGKRIVRYKQPVLRKGKRIWVDIEEFDTEEEVVKWDGDDYIGMMGREFVKLGRASSGKIGKAQSHLLGARAMRDFAMRWLEKRFGR